MEYFTDRIIYTNDDGGVSIVIPAEGVTLDKLLEKSVPNGADYEVVAVSEISSDRTFRNAWEKGAGGIATNLVKALVIAQDNVRGVRTTKLEELDVLAIRADEVVDATAKAEIVAKKNIARDSPDDPRLSVAQTEAELKTAMVTIQSEIQAL